MTRPQWIFTLATAAIAVVFLAGVALFTVGFFAARSSRSQVCSASEIETIPDCSQQAAKKFFTIDYSEAKDLGKSFLTLIVAVFVASVTFSEKIANLKESGRRAIFAMLGCWILLLLSLGMCGAGLTYQTIAMFIVSYRYRSPWIMETLAGGLFLLAGVSFMAALLCMLIAGLPSLFANPSFLGVEQNTAAPAVEPIVPQP
jgi:uncharacterized membrane protein YiaA